MSTASSFQVIRCQNCGAQNRLTQSEPGRMPICGRCKAPLLANAKPVIVTDFNFASEVESSPLPVLLDFWAAWCGPCRMIAPVIDQIAQETAGRVRVGKLNVDENPQTAARFRVQSIPTLLILKDGREIDRIVGAQSKEAILGRLRVVI